METNITGTKIIEQDSLNFYECTADTIDKFYLKSLALEEEPLLEQLRVPRSENTWRLGIQ